MLRTSSGKPIPHMSQMMDNCSVVGTCGQMRVNADYSSTSAASGGTDIVVSGMSNARELSDHAACTRLMNDAGSGTDDVGGQDKRLFRA